MIMKQITEIVRGYDTEADRQRAIRMFELYGYTHFVEFQDTQSDFALCYSR